MDPYRPSASERYTLRQDDRARTAHTLLGPRFTAELARAKRIADGWQIDRVKAGQSFILRDSSGRVVSRNVGMERQINRFYDDGSFDFELVALHGQHPAQGQDSCDVLGPLLG